MAVEIIEVHSKKELKEFICLPAAIHAHHVNWVPPIYSDEWKFYDPKHNNSLIKSDTLLLLATRDGKPAGRIMGIINKMYNDEHGEATARFFNFDSFDNGEVSHALLAAAEDWARKKGMTKIIGPFGFSDKDPQGLQIKGFENLAVIATATNMPYLQRLVEQEGYQKKIDCVVYRLDIPANIPEIYQRVYDRVIQQGNYKVIEFKSRRQLKPYIVPVLRLVNETYRSIFGFVAMDEEEMFQLAKRYLPILDPDFTKLVTDDQDRPVAFVVASPDMSKGIIRAKGKLFPFGFIQLLLSARKSKQLDLFLGAVKEGYRDKGLIALLGVTLLRSAMKRGMHYLDSHLILETNMLMRNPLERLGAVIYKRYRIYQKDL